MPRIRHRPRPRASKAAAKQAREALSKAHTRDSRQALGKLGELVDGRYQIVSRPPIIVPLRSLFDFAKRYADQNERDY